MLTKNVAVSSAKTFKDTLKYLFFGVTGIYLMWLAYRNQDFAEVWSILMEADFIWVVAIMSVSLLVNWIRALRWQLLIAPLGHKPSCTDTFAATMFGYLVNYAVPRLGEISRCAGLAKVSSAPFKPLLGTVVTERLVDVIALGLLMLGAGFWQWDTIAFFVEGQILEPLLASFNGQWEHIVGLLVGMMAIFISGVTLLFYYRRYFYRHQFIRKGIRVSLQIVEGVGSVRKLGMAGSILFFFYTAAIWYGYFLMTYLWFFMFPLTAALGVGAGLFIMIVGTLAKTLPIQGGGMGAYHFLVTQSMLLYGIPASYGNTLGFLMHGAQTVYHVVVGGLSIAWLIFRQKKS
jgi:uncharacterized protein (TIRG00374 family)